MNKNQQWVKILKDGCHKGDFYKKDEILEVDKWCSKDETVWLKNGPLVTVYNSMKYGKEAEFCSTPNKIYELWS